MIIVGVDGSAEAEAAAAWAVREAAPPKHDPLLVQAYEVPISPPRGMAAAIAHGREEGKALFDKGGRHLGIAADDASRPADRDRHPQALRPRLSEKADLMVLGDDHPALGGHMPFGDTARTAASMSRHPVVAVPRGRTPRADDRHPIAIDGRHPSTGTIGYSFTEASLRQVLLLVVHAALLAQLASGEQDSRLNLAQILAGWKADYPDINVETFRLAGSPPDTVLSVAADAQLLVVAAGDRLCPQVSHACCPAQASAMTATAAQYPDHASLARRRSSDASFSTAVLLIDVKPPQPGYLTHCDATAALVGRLAHRQALVFGHRP